MTTLKLPLWMIERIVQILSEHPYTGAGDIIQRIMEQTKEDAE